MAGEVQASRPICTGWRLASSGSARRRHPTSNGRPGARSGGRPSSMKEHVRVKLASKRRREESQLPAERRARGKRCGIRNGQQAGAVAGRDTRKRRGVPGRRRSMRDEQRRKDVPIGPAVATTRSIVDFSKINLVSH
jgi:hypothetical protein